MNEIRFIKLNGKRWQDFDQFLGKKQKSSPDHLAHLYIELTDDLAYAKTFFPKSKTTKYLNQITFKAHQQIFRRRKIGTNRLLNFFLFDYPLIIYNNRRHILYAFLIFLVSAIIGAVSLNLDDEFARAVLGDSYVNMTIDNIEKGDPLGIYDSTGQWEMFFSIAWNNIRVSFVAFASGILFTIGTYIILFQNGIMIGVFQFFFFQKNLLTFSVLTIWMHGTIEITSIIIASAAGLVMGTSLLFPGTYKRTYSFQKGAMQGVKMVAGLIPFFIIAAFIESFLTRHSEESLVLDALIIGLSGLFIIFYFYIYPYILTKKTNINE